MYVQLTNPAKESSLSQEFALVDITSTEGPSPSDTTVETKLTTVVEPTEVVDPGDVLLSWSVGKRLWPV